MRRFLLLLLFPQLLWAQGSRYDSAVLTSANNVPYGGQAAVYTVPFAYIKVCAYPAVGNPCTNVVNVYSDPGLTQPITQPFQADNHGRFGFWAAPGEYSYNVQSTGGTNYGNFTITLAGTGGGSATFPSTPGIVYSLNTSSARNATSADITGLFTGCSGTLFLRADGTCGGSGLSLTTTGTSGLATLSGTTLNIPNYTYTLTTAAVTALGALTNDTSGSAAKIDGVTVSGVPAAGQVPVALSSTTASWQTPITYPGAGIPNSTGTAWGTSYGVSGTGNVALTDSPTFTGTVQTENLNASAQLSANIVAASGISGQMYAGNAGAPATSGSNTNSIPLSVIGSAWNGTVAIADSWSFTDTLGTGTNPASTLILSHSGSSGVTSVSFPSLSAPTVTATTALKTASYTVSGLPSAATAGAGAIVRVSDSTSFTAGPCTGGGSDTMLAVSDGTSWTCH